MKIPNIPFIMTPDKELVGTTQEFIPIIDIAEDIVLLRDGGAAVVLESTSLNYGLLSEKEQQAVNAAYAALLSSLSFSVQILVRSLKKDITNYLKYLDIAESKIQNPKLKILMTSYRTFIAETIKKRNVLSKRFYLIIPLSPYELGVVKSFATITKRKGPLPFSKSYAVNKAKITLFPRRDHLMRQAGRLGLKLRQLTKNQLVELFYEVFNPPVPTMKKTQEVKQANG